MFYFSLVMSTQEGVSSSGSGSGAGTETISEQMQEFISSEITCGILEQTPLIFGSIKEGVLEILNEHLGTFCAEVLAIVGTLTLSFFNFFACGAPTFSWEKDPIASRRWLTDMVTYSGRVSTPNR